MNPSVDRSAAAQLADFAIALDSEVLPNDVKDDAKRALANVVGVALGGCRSKAAERAWAAMNRLGGQEQARVVGIGSRSAVDRVAVVDGIAAHVLDYDDTQLQTVYHPSAPIFAALAPLGEWRGVTGAAFLDAWLVGLEVGIRLASALTREHYDRGWHVTGTAGGVAAAAASSKLLGLTHEQFVHAIGIAATQASSHRIHFGTMTKSLHVGMAGSTGVMAALLAEQGFDADAGSLEGRRGLLEVMASEPEPAVLTVGLGTEWRLTENRIKPYACGVVTHPLIDSTRELRELHGVRPEDVEEIVITVEPLVTELTGNTSPTSELEAKFSAWHCAAVGLLRGQAGPAEFEDELVVAPDTVALRDRIRIEASERIPHMTASLTARLKSGETVEVRLNQARGTPERQLTDDELAVKFADVSAPILSSDRARHLCGRLMRVNEEASWESIVDASLPDHATRAA